MQEINIHVPPEIIENKELDSIGKLILSLSYTYKRNGKYDVTFLTNKEIAELFSLSEATVGKHRKILLKKEYETKEKNIYTITDKYKETKPTKRTKTIIPPDVYKLKLKTGAKLLWGEYNALSKGGAEDSYAPRSYFEERLNCSSQSITNWTKELNEKGLFSVFKLKKGRNSSQRIVRTINFSNKNSLMSVSDKKRKEIWKEYIGDKSSLRKIIGSNKSTSEYLKELYVNVDNSNNKRKIVSSLLFDLKIRLKNKIYSDLKELIKNALKQIDY